MLQLLVHVISVCYISGAPPLLWCPSTLPLMQPSAQKGSMCATMEGDAEMGPKVVSAYLDMEGSIVKRSSQMSLVS